MKKLVLTLLATLAMAISPVLADVTFTVNVPAGTKQCFVVGALPQLANWSAGAAVSMDKVEGKDQFTVTIKGITADDVKASDGYKYTCGPSWDYVEKTASGGEVSNRKTIGNPDVVAKWLKVYESVGIVENYTIDTQTYPVQILLPTNYDKAKTYDVTYMFARHMRYRDAGDDNQMGDRILYSDSWNVAGAIKKMEEEGLEPGIVAVIYAQLPQFTPWESPDFMGTGKAYAFAKSFYVDFLSEFEQKYPVNPKTRTIMGADVAGLFAYYTAALFPDVFASCGLFSPSFWYNREELKDFMSSQTPTATHTKFVFTSAKNDMDFTREDNQTFSDLLKEVGFSDIKILNSTTGMHDDKTWGTQFPLVFKHLKGISTDASLETHNATAASRAAKATDATTSTWTFMKGEGTTALTCTEYQTTKGKFYKNGSTPVDAQLLVVEIPVVKKDYKYYWNLNDGANCNGNKLMSSPKDIGFKTSRTKSSWQRVAVFADGTYEQGAASSEQFTANGVTMTKRSNFEQTANLNFTDAKTIEIKYGSVNSGSPQSAILASAKVSDNCIKAKITYSYLTNQLTVTETAWGEVGSTDIDLAYFRGEPAVVRTGTPVTVKVKINNLNGNTVAYRMNHNNSSSTAITLIKGADGEYSYTLPSAKAGIYGFYMDATYGGETTKAYRAIYVKVLDGNTIEPIIKNNPYADIDWSTINQYKGNFHTHTTQSNDAADGFTTAYVVDKYHQAGYKILSLTDHDYNPYPWELFPQFMPSVAGRSPKDLGMLAVPGNELSKDNTNSWSERTGGQFNHHNDFYTGRQGQEFASLQESYAYTYALGGMQIINHPGQYWDISKTYSETAKDGPGWHATNFKTYPSLIGLEVYNQGNRRPNDRILWDQILERTMPERPVYGYSCDDAHNNDQLFKNYNFMLMEDLTTDELKDAMRKGETYFCYEPAGTGQGKAPRITAIAVDEQTETITIETNGLVHWIYGTDQTSTAASSTRSTVIGMGNTFCYKGFQGSYVRAFITNPYGETCTQPICFVDKNGTSIDQVEAEGTLTMVLYPNPTTNQISVFMNDADTEENIEVFDLNGKPILSQPVAGATTILPTQNLAAGMYMVRVGNRSGKFIKK
jgi:predicted alpha/beta superfamily hydrolase